MAAPPRSASRIACSSRRGTVHRRSRPSASGPPAVGRRARAARRARRRAGESPCSLRSGRRSTARLVAADAGRQPQRARRRRASRARPASRRSSAFGITRTRSAGTWRCWRTTGSSARSVAMMRSAARAQASTARRSGRYPARFSRARRGFVAPNSSRPCGLNTSGAALDARRLAYPSTLAPSPWTMSILLSWTSSQAQPARAHAEQRIRRAAIDHGRAAPARERERPVRDRQRDAGSMASAR